MPCDVWQIKLNSFRNHNTHRMECNKVLVRRPSSQLVLVIELSSPCKECDSCPKPVVNCHLQQHQCPAMDKVEDEVFESISETKSDQSSLHSEGISYEETGSVYDYDSYNSLDDQQTVDTCRRRRCSDKLVIPKHDNNWSLPSDSDHTTVCRYCREEVKNCYYDHHLTRCTECSTDFRISCERCSLQCNKTEKQGCKIARELGPQYSNHQFIVTCTAVQASD